jgi:hypothetical protein
VTSKDIEGRHETVELAPPAGVEPTTYRLGVVASSGRASSSIIERERKQKLISNEIPISYPRFWRQIGRS